MCSEQFHKFYRKAPVSESLFNKVASLVPATKKEALELVFSVNLTKSLRIPFLQNTSGRLLLFLKIFIIGF